MKKRISIRDVSQLAGVSVSCASLVFTGRQGKVPLAPATIEKVLDAARQLDYRPNRQAQILRSGDRSSGTIGLIISDRAASGELNQRVLTGVCRAASLRHYECLMTILGDDDSGQLANVSCISNKQVDGIIAIGLESLELPAIQAVLGSRIPVTCVHIQLEHDDELYSYVKSDDCAGGRLAARCLTMAGHRRLGFIGGAAQGDAARARLRGVREVAALAGLPEVRVLFGDYRSVDAEAMRALLLAPDAPTGLVACSDLIAAWLLTELPRWGFAVPRDVSVVGYDDEVLTPYLNPPLTTVRQDGLDEGRMAAELLIRLIEKEPVEQRFITLAPQLIERASVAPPPAKREREA